MLPAAALAPEKNQRARGHHRNLEDLKKLSGLVLQLFLYMSGMYELYVLYNVSYSSYQMAFPGTSTQLTHTSLRFENHEVITRFYFSESLVRFFL